MLKIDSHTHILPEKLPNFAEKFGYGDFIHLEHHKPGRAKMMKGNSFFREIKSNCWDAAERKSEYEEHQVKVQVVCTVPVMFSYWAKAEDTYELAKFLNDDIARTCEQHPLRYFGLGTLPMQNIDLAIKEMERCVKILGLKGFQIGSNINDVNLSDERFEPFYRACEELGAALMIHPWEMMGMESMRKYILLMGLMVRNLKT